jgi:hypothetical protein
MKKHIEQYFLEIKNLEENKNKLYAILDTKKIINIQLHFFADHKHMTIYQKDSPYNLEHELRNLFASMIEQIDMDIDNLKTTYNEECKN